LTQASITSTFFQIESDLEAVLHAIGAEERPHGGGRSLADHLRGTYEILISWGAPTDVAVAGLFHSVYSTDSYHQVSVHLDKRPAMQIMLGEDAERLVFLFHLCPQQVVLEAVGLLRRAGNAEQQFRISRGNGTAILMTRPELFKLLQIHSANFLEQSRGQDGSPGLCLSRITDWECLVNPFGVALWPLVSNTSSVELHDEHELRDAYRKAFEVADSAREVLFKRCSELVPIVPEPLMWRGWALARLGRRPESQPLFEAALGLARGWGTTWDKRITYVEIISLLEQLCSVFPDPAITRLNELASRFCTPPIALVETDRLARYVHNVRQERASSWYPGLPSRPWHDANEYSIVSSLQDFFPELQKEVRALNLDGQGFHEEAENIQRTGSWTVFMLWEGGRRREDNCARVPKLASILAGDPQVRLASGLVYLSRLAAHTHIAPHRGPSNFRVRLHLPFQVPIGDCAMRVGSEIRGWTEGKALIFDDLYEHEVWNETEQDRIVLVADLWPASMNASEIAVLSALDIVAYAQAEGRARYWANNERQRTRERGRTGDN
jgi:hypothetical protein